MYERYLKGRDGLIPTTRRRERDRTSKCRGGAGGAGARKYLTRSGCEHPEVRGAGGIPGHGEKGAKAVSIIIMNPQNGEIYAMVNVPEFDLNDPFSLNVESGGLWGRSFRMREQNVEGIAVSTIRMSRDPHLRSSPPQQGWRREWSIWMTGFPVRASGSWKTGRSAVIRSADMVRRYFYRSDEPCNPVFIDVGQRLVDSFYHYFEQFGLLGKTGIDLPGEAATIMHKKENMGLVELADGFLRSSLSRSHPSSSSRPPPS